jgi:hypothetical protein
MSYLPLICPEIYNVLQLKVVADLVGQCQSRKSRTNAYYSKLSRSPQRAIVKRGAKCGVGHGESKRGGEIEIERDDISDEAIEDE